MSFHQHGLPYREHRVVASDGVALAVQSLGEGPTVLLANGMGLTRPALDMLASHLQARHRVISWDYRGAGASAVAADTAHLDMFTIARHARDGLEVLDALGVGRAVVMGWSMGVPVGLELFRLAAERVAGFAALFGSAGPPFRAAFDSPLCDLVELGFRGSRHVPWPADALVQLGATVPALAWAFCSAIGFVGQRAQRHLFREVVATVASADKRIYLATMKHLMAHDARDILPEVRCPALIVAGEDDWVAPPPSAIEMQRSLPHAALHILPGTSHFGVMEHGPALWQPVDDLLARVAAAA